MMAAFAIRKTFPQQVGKHTAPAKSRNYLAFIHRLPCVVTMASPVEAAHLSYASRRWGHPGRGKQRKAADRWALPLSAEQHRAQHGMSERAYWQKAGIDPHALACALWGRWNELKDDDAAEEACRAIIIEWRSGR